MKATSILLIIALLGLSENQVKAETTIEEVEESNPNQQQIPSKKPKLSPEEVQKLKEKKKKQTRKLQSCLILTRAFYQQNEKLFSKYLQDHPAILHPSAKTNEKMNRNMLLSKINA
jgi:reverse gyrase